MTKEEKFIQDINEIRETAVMQGGYITEEQIEEVFPAVTEDQKKLLLDYFKENNIGIGSPLDEKDYLGEDEQKLIKIYMDELEGIDEPDADMKRVLVMNAKNGDKNAKEQLMNAYLKVVVDTAKLYTGQGAETSDLIGEGNVALADALSKLDSLDSPEDLDEMVMRMIMNSMEALIDEENAEAAANREALALVMKIMGKAKDMHDELGRKVSVEELADEGEFTYEDIYEAIRLSDNCGDYIIYNKE